MPKSHLILLLFLLPTIGISQYYVKEYTYNASENESKLDARRIALKEVKRLLIEELGVYIVSETTLYKNNEDVKISIETQTKVISECVTQTKILEENWDGDYYYIKVKLYVDQKDLERRLKKIYREEENRKSTNISSSKKEDKVIPHKSNKIDFKKESYAGAIYGSFLPYNDLVSIFGLSLEFITDNKIGIGFYGEINFAKPYNSKDDYLRYQSLGIFIDLLFFNTSTVNLSFPIKISKCYVKRFDDGYKIDGSSGFLIEPAIDVGFAITDSFKITTGVSYKIINNVELNDMVGVNLSGVTINLSLKFISQ